MADKALAPVILYSVEQGSLNFRKLGVVIFKVEIIKDLIHFIAILSLDP